MNDVKRVCTRCGENLWGPTHYIWSTRSSKKNTPLHFCNWKCQLIFFKGRKYYARKLAYMEQYRVVVETKSSITKGA